MTTRRIAPLVVLALTLMGCGGGDDKESIATSTLDVSDTETTLKRSTPTATSAANTSTSTVRSTTTTDAANQATPGDEQACAAIQVATVDAAAITTAWFTWVSDTDINIDASAHELESVQALLLDAVAEAGSQAEDSELSDKLAGLEDEFQSGLATVDVVSDPVQMLYDKLIAVDEGVLPIFTRCTVIRASIDPAQLAELPIRGVDTTSTSSTTTSTTAAPTTTALPQLDPVTVAQYTSVSDFARLGACETGGILSCTGPGPGRRIDARPPVCG